MNLILQAIKALLRKVDNTITKLSDKVDNATSKLSANVEKSVSKLSTAVTKAQNTADDAKQQADYATEQADYAKSAANTAQASANHVYPVTVDGATATVVGALNLVDGYVYTFISRTTTTTMSNAYIKVGQTSYPVLCGINKPIVTSYSNVYVKSDTIFQEGEPVTVLYSQKKKAFYCLTRDSSANTVETAASISSGVPTYFYGYYTNNKAERYRYMRVKSSTPGSKKKFDITVDDSGTITAVEVT